MTIARTFLAAIAGLCGMVLAIPVMMLLLPFLTVKFLIRAIAKLIEPRFISWRQIIEFDPTFGWKAKPHLNTYVMADDVFHITTDSQGWRGKTSLAESQVVVFGDSHAFGFGTSDQWLYTEINPRLPMKAIGVNGYNTVQQLLWMDRLKSQLRDKLVVWFIFIGNDLYDNLEPSLYEYRIPFVRQDNGTQNWEIVTSHLHPNKWPFVSRRFKRVDYDRLTKIYSPNFVAQRAFAACEFLIEQGKELCMNAGAHLVVMTIPDPLPLSQSGLETLYAYGADPQSFDPDFPDKKLSEICARLDIPFIAGSTFLTADHYKKLDDHWNESGHKIVAEVLERIYQEHLSVYDRKRYASKTV